MGAERQEGNKTIKNKNQNHIEEKVRKQKTKERMQEKKSLYSYMMEKQKIKK